MTTEPAAEEATPESTGDTGPLKRFGWFSGVFTPSVLTILGVIMYLRMGWVVGNAGLLGAIAIIVISHLITVATGLSVSSIATNRTVGAGGAYNIISRSLGAPVGAAIGIPLFLGQALSVTFYIVGFSESVAYLYPDIDQRSLSLLVLLVLAGISMKSAELAIKSQYVVMAAIGLSLVSFFLGEPPSRPQSITWLASEGAGFGAVFAVFFPAVTGIMAGVGMSGDLRDPKRDLPLGTMAAIGTGFLVYMTIPVAMALLIHPSNLANDPDVFWTASRWPMLIYFGVWGATISSAVGSLLTAPRTLQALAIDRLAPTIAGKGFGPANEPRVGLAVTFAIAVVGILLGNLDVIAPVLTMFFLATYGFTNLACGLEKWAASPSFRPAFGVPAWVSLAGGLACFYVMSIISLPAMLLAMACCFAIYVTTRRRQLESDYGDARWGIWSAMTRSALLGLERAEFHPQNWRPNVIVFGGDPRRRYLLEIGSALVQNRGVVTYFQLLPGSVDEHADRRKEVLLELEETHRSAHDNVFFRVDVVSEVPTGVVAIAQSYGVGRFEANTVVLGWSNRPERSTEYVGMLHDLATLDRSLVVVRYVPEVGWGARREIHVWWGGLQGNGGLMLLLASLLSTDAAWRGAEVKVLTVVDDADMQSRAETQLARLLSAARVNATPRVLLRQERSIPEIMSTESAAADLAILGFAMPERERAAEFVERMERLLASMPSTLLVHSARGFDSEPVLFEG